MRWSNAASEAALNTPEGLSPALIGKVVTVKMIEKSESDGHIMYETVTKLVGKLLNYSHDATSVEFLVEGAEHLDISFQRVHIEFIAFDGA